MPESCRKYAHNGVELQYAEAEPLCLREAVQNQLFADVHTAAAGVHSVARVRDMPQPSGIVRVKDVQPHDRAVVLRDAAIALRGEEFAPALLVETFLLRECDAVLHDLVPDTDHRGHVATFILSDERNIPSIRRPEPARFLLQLFDRLLK